MKRIVVAMLRGINVSGHKPVKMEALRASFERLGCDAVRTYVQSGNVVFTTTAAPGTALVRKIEAQLARDFGFAVPVMLRTARELSRVVDRNPFLKRTSIDRSRLHVTFLAEPPARKALADLLQLSSTPPDEFELTGREVYLLCPNGYGRTKLSNTAFERLLGVNATTRNWKTVTTLLAMAATRPR